jgi:hypothetical protein
VHGGLPTNELDASDDKYADRQKKVDVYAAHHAATGTPSRT